MLERENQKRHYKNRKSTHTFKIGDLVLTKQNKDKLEIKWEPNYRIPITMVTIVENQSNGTSKRCNITDLKSNGHLKI